MNANVVDPDDGENCVEDAPVTTPCEGDDDWNFEILATGSGADTIEGDEANAFDETMIGNANDDVMDGNAGIDFASWRDSAGPITVDTAAGTATGDGNDSWTETEGVDGSANLDDLLNFGNETGPNEVSLCDGEADATSFEFISGSDLGVGNDIGEAPLCTSTFEHVTGSPGNDFIEGDSGRNNLDGNAGNDVIDGLAGNDTLIGATGNDTFTGGIGADTVSFATNTTAGVQADLSLGFATSSDSGDDAFTDLVEIVVGSSFNDQVTGGPFAGGGTINFLFKGRAGNDSLTGFSGNDTLNGGNGKDTLRGVAGDDTLNGKKGNDLLSGGGGFDIGNGGKGKDVCKSVEQKKSCGSSQNPKAPQSAVGKVD
jgi:Ca2+-binding RTX toxin-like protein